MKKVYLLSGMVVLGVITGINVNAKRIPPQQPGQLSIEEVQRRKLARQKELARKPAYKMLDSLIVDQQGHGYVIKNNIDWSSVFHILDSMKGVIGVNEYTAPDEYDSRLLDIAVATNNLLATKTLLEKYKADPNKDPYTPFMIICNKSSFFENSQAVYRSTFGGPNKTQPEYYEQYKTIYENTYKPMIILLLKHGVNKMEAINYARSQGFVETLITLGEYYHDPKLIEQADKILPQTFKR